MLFRSIGLLKTYQRFIPIMLGENQRTVLDILQESLIQNRDGEEMPLSSLVRLNKEQGYKSITSSKNGEYVPLVLKESEEKAETVIEKIRSRLKGSSKLEAGFVGTYFTQKELFREMGLVLLISVMLLYFILAAQFESFSQPLIEIGRAHV